ncbi:MAG: YbhB/YbcL family Raf kinase inhibitor-like protein [Aquabacterium sp.]|nr:MAG: YbhB/YbcL family Raf kinase inhibitor-like protein [Aquabacterium sp.]
MPAVRPPRFPIPTAAACAAALLPLLAQAAGFSIDSPDLAPGARLAADQVYRGFGCEGGNRSPALRWQGAPAGTRSFALTVYDPDAPTGSGWWHWVVYNLPADATGLPAGAGSADGARLPAGAVQGRTDYGTPGYGGACPPSGDAPHRYRFTVHALKAERLDLPADASAAMVGYMIHLNSLGQATLEGRYGR